MVMVSSAVLGAACGTGFALMIAMTLVVYRYYAARKKCKEWDELEKCERRNLARQINIQVGFIPFHDFDVGSKVKCLIKLLFSPLKIILPIFD